MSKLVESQCVACRTGAPKVTEAELAELIQEIPDWQVKTRNSVMQLEREYAFPNFNQAINFTNAVAELAESEDHHPSLLTEWGKVTVTWWTHKIKGLHRNDLIMAAKTDQLYSD